MAINLKHRKKGLGASESAAALGYSEYKTPLDIYREKLGLAPAFEGNAYTLRGSRLEDIVAQYFGDGIELEFDEAKVLTISELYELYPNFQFPSGCERTFLSKPQYKVVSDNYKQPKQKFLDLFNVKTYPRKKLIVGTDTFVSVEHPFMFSSPDRILILRPGDLVEINGVWQVIENMCGVEIKTAQSFSLNTEEDVIEQKQEWLFQAYYNMIVTGLRRWYITWAKDFNLQTKYFYIDFDEKLAQEIINETSNFWHNHILAEIPPEPQTVEDNNYLYPNPTSEPPLEATHELYAVLKEYEGYKADARILEAKAEALKDRIACAVGNSSLITFGGVKVATYNAQTSKRLDTERLKVEMPDVYEQYLQISQTRVLRITKPKKEK